MSFDLNAGHFGPRAGVRRASNGGYSAPFSGDEPAALPRFVAERRHDEQVARACGGDVGQADAFGLIARHFLGLVLVQLVRRPAADPHRAQAATPDRDTGSRRSRLSRQVRSARMTTGNSRPLALCTVISRTPSLLSSRIGASAASDSAAVAELVDEAAERDAAAPPRTAARARRRAARWPAPARRPAAG